MSRLQNTPSSGKSHEDSLKSRDEALLRRCLREFQSFEAGMRGLFDGEFKEIIAALRERLGETQK